MNKPITFITMIGWGVLYLWELFTPKRKPAPDSFPSPVITDWTMYNKDKNE